MPTTQQSQRHHLLIVDDHPEISQLIMSLLPERDWQIEIANSIPKALHALEQREFDCLLSDIYLGEESGLQLLATVRESYPELTVLLMTGNPSVELTISGFTGGAYDFLVKPFSHETLLATLSRAMTHHQMQKENMSLLGQLQFLKATSSMELSGNVDQYVRQVLLSLQAETGAQAVGYLELDPDERTVVRRHHIARFSEDILAVMDERLFQKSEITRGTRPVVYQLEADSLPRTLIVKPLVFKTTLFGVITALVHKQSSQIRQGVLDVISVLAGAMAATIANQQLYQDVRISYLQAIKALANSIEARDSYTAGHTDRVTRLAERLARRLGWSERRLENLVVGCTLHDIGKIGVPDAVLNKRGKLTPEEREIMQRHPLIGLKIINHVDLLVSASPYVIAHHERFDGGGYPYGLAGNSIPIEGRLLAVVDTFDAILSDRPYRPGAGADVAIREILAARGKQFDPQMVDLFVGVLTNQEIDLDELYGRPLDLTGTLQELLSGTVLA